MLALIDGHGCVRTFGVKAQRLLRDSAQRRCAGTGSVNQVGILIEHVVDRDAVPAAPRVEKARHELIDIRLLRWTGHARLREIGLTPLAAVQRRSLYAPVTQWRISRVCAEPPPPVPQNLRLRPRTSYRTRLPGTANGALKWRIIGTLRRAARRRKLRTIDPYITRRGRLTFDVQTETLAIMATTTTPTRLARELTDMLASHLSGIEVAIDQTSRWDRPCVTFRWEGFADLLPEERFQRLMRRIPPSFIDENMPGFVWLELAPGESVDEFLKQPRSEDVAKREAGIYGELMKVGFFDALSAMLGANMRAACPGSFRDTQAVLKKKKRSSARITDAKLLFIRYGAYCDCQVLQTVRAELAQEHSKAG